MYLLSGLSAAMRLVGFACRGAYWGQVRAQRHRMRHRAPAAAVAAAHLLEAGAVAAHCPRQSRTSLGAPDPDACSHRLPAQRCFPQAPGGNTNLLAAALAMSAAGFGISIAAQMLVMGEARGRRACRRGEPAPGIGGPAAGRRSDCAVSGWLALPAQRLSALALGQTRGGRACQVGRLQAGSSAMEGTWVRGPHARAAP